MNDEQEKLIRFIDSQYNTLFYVSDGGNIVITREDGEKLTRRCTFLDETHTQVGNHVYHICEFAERMERVGNTYVPEKPPELPPVCMAILPDTGEAVLITKGKKGYQNYGPSSGNLFYDRQTVDRFNANHRVTRQQEAAMLGGATRGWSTPAARTSSYDVRGEKIKPPARARTRKPKEPER